MSKFLYGTAIQGIQSFILQTNKLREIVGASEMVAHICSRLFYELLTRQRFKSDKELEDAMGGDKNLIVHAAGNIKFIFEDRSECERIVREFPKLVVEYAPGITVSQAVVEYEGDFASAVVELENNLAVQRNKPARSATLGLMGIARSRQTGLPSVVRDGINGLLDDSTWKKRNNSNRRGGLFARAFGSFPDASRIAFDLSKLTTEDNSWIAVIHADGNGLGSIVQKIGDSPIRFKKFSEDLDKATTAAAQKAFTIVCGGLDPDAIIPIRPIVLSGDDLTVICRADIAIPFTKAFLKAFEEKTAEFKLITKEDRIFTGGTIHDRMTACAGIAFVKASYPFYYAYRLAESLCNEAKKDAKDKPSIREGSELPQSCLLFHKVRDSFTEDYEEIVRRELSPKPGMKLNFGPYYISGKDSRWTVEQLMKKASDLEGEKGNTVKNTIRQWLALLFRNSGQETQLLERAQQLYKSERTDGRLALLESAVKPLTEGGPVPAYDLLVVNSLIC